MCQVNFTLTPYFTCVTVLGSMDKCKMVSGSYIHICISKQVIAMLTCFRQYSHNVILVFKHIGTLHDITECCFIPTQIAHPPH